MVSCLHFQETDFKEPTSDGLQPKSILFPHLFLVFLLDLSSICRPIRALGEESPAEDRRPRRVGERLPEERRRAKGIGMGFPCSSCG